MAGWRYRVILFVLVPAILAAAVFLGYTTWGHRFAVHPAR